MKSMTKRTRAQPLRSLTDTMLRINAAINQEPLDTARASEPERRKARLFISFSRHDAEIVATLARKLEEQGFPVWWSGLLAGGQVFPDEIGEKLDEADAVLVLWSPHSIMSTWVQSEAARALDQRKLIPLRLPTFDPAAIPLPFGTLHTIVLGDVDGLVHAIELLRDAPSVAAPRATK